MNTSIRCLQECCELLQDTQDRLIITELIDLVSSSKNINIIATLTERTGLDQQIVTKAVRQATKYGKENLGIHNIAESISEDS